MDEQTLRVFLLLAETENMRDAAAILHVNQSNVSRSLARLEEQIDGELFDRRGRRLRLNERGALFRVEAEAVLRAIEHARRRLDAFGSQVPSVRIGFLHSVGRWMLPPAVAAFRTLRPDVHIDVRQGFGPELYDWLARELIDVALGAAPLRAVPGVTWIDRAGEDLLLAVPAGHPLADRADILPSRDLHGLPFIGFSPTTELHAVIARLLPERVQMTYEGSEIETMRALVGAGLGVSILPVRPGRTDAGIAYVPLRVPVQRRLGVAWSEASGREPHVRRFVEATRSI
jgi:DNA-binding transcriptional LysR family regulator